MIQADSNGAVVGTVADTILHARQRREAAGVGADKAPGQGPAGGACAGAATPHR